MMTQEVDKVEIVEDLEDENHPGRKSGILRTEKVAQQPPPKKPGFFERLLGKKKAQPTTSPITNEDLDDTWKNLWPDEEDDDKKT